MVSNRILWILRLFATIITFAQQSTAITAGTYMHITRATSLVGCSVYKRSKEENELGCARSCGRSEGTCVRASYHIISRTCKLTEDDISNQCKNYSSPEYILIERLGTYDQLTAGLRNDNPVSSCKSLKKLQRKSGIYWLDPDGGSHDNAFQALCDMDTDGGGWTLVWSYTFTDYSHFNTGENAITPRPNWAATNVVNVPVSTQVPLTDKHYGALDFQQWKVIGEEFLMKSNINNWVACEPKTGNLVKWVSGNVTCRLVKHVTTLCNNTLPYRVNVLTKYGPSLEAQRFYYYYDGNTTTNWPTHDPCGENHSNQVEGVADPRGSILIR